MLKIDAKSRRAKAWLAGKSRMLSIKTNRVAQTASSWDLLVNYKMMLVAMPTRPTGFCFYSGQGRDRRVAGGGSTIFMPHCG